MKTTDINRLYKDKTKLFDKCSPDGARERARERARKRDEKSNSKKCGGQSLNIDYDGLADTFNTLCPSLPPIKSVTEKRRAKLRTLVKNMGNGNKILLELFKKTEASDYLSGRNGKWMGCAFDWIIDYNNAVKIMEGNYDNGRGGNTVPPQSRPVSKTRFSNFPERPPNFSEIEKLERERLIKLHGDSDSQAQHTSIQGAAML